ncbi:MAG: stage II sporulation protein M, partial [Gammaproteobacteria bacterium]|nr:stage II sporulation protein M [Gammaproteobacteria bacterium]
MRQKEFENRYQQTWDAFAQKLDQVESIKRRKSVLNNDLKRYDEDYRTLCYCLSLARERQYSPYLIKRLEKLVFRGHQVFYQRKIGIFYQIYRFILFGFPAAVRKQSKFIWIATGIFYLPALIIFALVLLFPELVYSIVEPGQVAEIESMYDPGLDKIGRGRDRASDTDFAMFGHYVWNNIGIAFREFAGGFMATLGT